MTSVTTHPSSRQNSLSGMGLGAAAFALMTGVDIIYKLVAAHHPAYQIIFVAASFGLIPILAWAQMTGGIKRIQTTHPIQHTARAMASLMSGFAAIYAYSRLPLTDFYAIVFAGPLLITVLSFLCLGEKVDRSRWIAILVGFGGILIITDPTGHEAHGSAVAAVTLAMGRFAAFISVACYAVSVLMIRRMRLGESNMAFPFYGYMTAMAFCAGLLWFEGAPELTNQEIIMLVFAGIMGGIASICLNTAYQRTPVALVAPFQYSQILWGSLAGYFIWDHVPDQPLVTGAVVVAACGLFVIYQEIYGRATP